jgi:choline kinase
MERHLQAVILAAGRGERLRPLTRRVPKAMIPVAGRPILGRMLAALAKAGLRSIVLVLGYRAALIQRYVTQEFARLDVRFLRNPIYARTNTLYSLWVARSAVEGRPFLLLDGDLVFDPAILRTLLRNGRGNLIVCDRSRILDGEAVHVFGNRDGNIVRIGKDADGSGQSLGESIGLARIGGKASRQLFGVARALLRRGARAQYYEAAFQRVIQEGMRFVTLDVGKSKWVEIDTPWDLHRARVFLNGSAKRAG